MNFLELARKRFSGRNYSPDAIEQEKLDYIIECARLAPSAANCQPWTFVIVKSEEQKQNIRECYTKEWFANAPLYIIVCVNEASAWIRQYDNKNHADIDAAIATEHICLAASEQGLGSCWVCNFDPEKLQNKMRLSADMYPVAIVSLGHLNGLPTHASPRKEIKEIVTII